MLLSDSEDEEVLVKSEEIPDRLGIDDIETDAACVGCHFSYYRDEEGEEQLTSIDCESCHGAAAGWVDVHSAYGTRDGAQIERAEDELPAHRATRRAKAKAKGMRHPDDIVSVTRNCLGCHTGPGEKIVNVGGHSPGSEFELVSWLDGEVRHNFHRTNQGGNDEIAIERKRQLYVTGRALDLEYAFRGLAKATQDGPYLQAMTRRTAEAKGHLKAVASRVSLPELEEMNAAADGVALEANNRANAEAAADRVHAAAIAFANAHDGSGLEAIDSLIPKQRKGSVYTGN